MSRVIPAGATVGIVGGGQLGQMLAQSAVQMGFQVVTLDPTPGAPASRVSDQIVAAYDDEEALRELAQRADVLTFEFENVDAHALSEAGGYLPQGTRALEICKDRLKEKQFLTQSGIPVAPYREVHDRDSLEAAVAEVGLPAVLKTTQGGYDGKGQVVLRHQNDLETASELLSVQCVLEKWIEFDKEISVIVCGTEAGVYAVFPVGENVHVNNILFTTTVPARVSSQTEKRAQDFALQIADAIGLVGVMGVEMFVAPGGELYVNELAPRPHNSGHYSIEACDQSQFDLHIRAICGWQIGAPRLLSPAVMTNVLGQDMARVTADLADHPEWNVHLYGKSEAKRDRKMGHITELVGRTS